MMQFNKENSFIDDYVVFDLETTGFDPKECKIVEIGALKYKKGELVDTFSVLVNPECNVPSEITRVTGITNEMVQNERTIEEVMPEFISFIEDLTLVAHNSQFDLSFIEENLLRLNIDIPKNKNIDTVILARKYIPKAYNHKLETLKKFFKLEYDSHRSLEDCYTTNYVYQYCKNKAGVTN